MPSSEGVRQQGKTTWSPQAASPAQHPHMTLDFARVYERTANRITGPISFEALRRAAPIVSGTRILDIAAGAGALSVPAAHGGASVLAVDIAPGMVELLTDRLAPFPNAEARVMDGQALALGDASFDAAFSIIGVNLFADWRRGLAEMARVVRLGGRAAVAVWRKPPGGGPFHVMAQAMRTVFPGQPPPAPPEGFVALADPARLGSEFEAVGFIDVAVEEIEAVWEGPAGPEYLDELRGLHPYMGPYAGLSPEDRRRVDDVILSIVDEVKAGDRIRLVSPVLLATGTRG